MFFICTSITEGIKHSGSESKNKFLVHFFWLILVSGIICRYLCPGSSTFGFNVQIRWLMWQFLCSTGREKYPSSLYLWAWEWIPPVSINLFRHSLVRVVRFCNLDGKLPIKVCCLAVGNHNNRALGMMAAKWSILSISERTSVSYLSAFAQSDLIQFSRLL